MKRPRFHIQLKTEWNLFTVRFGPDEQMEMVSVMNPQGRPDLPLFFPLPVVLTVPVLCPRGQSLLVFSCHPGAERRKQPSVIYPHSRPHMLEAIKIWEKWSPPEESIRLHIGVFLEEGCWNSIHLTVHKHTVLMQLHYVVHYKHQALNYLNI